MRSHFMRAAGLKEIELISSDTYDPELDDDFTFTISGLTFASGDIGVFVLSARGSDTGKDFTMTGWTSLHNGPDASPYSRVFVRTMDGVARLEKLPGVLPKFVETTATKEIIGTDPVWQVGFEETKTNDEKGDRGLGPAGLDGRVRAGRNEHADLQCFRRRRRVAQPMAEPQHGAR